MKKTKIDWADSTWNPVTGCEHGCPYCYARGIAQRFGTNWLPDENHDTYKCVLDGMKTHAIIELDGMQARRQEDGKIVTAPYPLGFAPTLHRYRLDEPRRWTKPRTIFVCSMADLFGEWVPDSWIEDVFDACENAPQHRYLFLTKNPKKCKGCPYYDKCMMADAHTDLHTDALEYIQQLENHIGKLTEKVKQIRAEQQNLICDFMDYINDGVQNPAPYCAFGKSCVLVDKRGWCRPGEHECNGSVPRVRDDNENA